MQFISSGYTLILSRHEESTGWGVRVNFSCGVGTFVKGPKRGFGGASECGVSGGSCEGGGGGEGELWGVLVGGGEESMKKKEKREREREGQREEMEKERGRERGKEGKREVR